MSNNLSALKEKYIKLESSRQSIQDSIGHKTERIAILDKRIMDYIQARSIVSEIAQATVGKFLANIEKIISSALTSVFEKPLQLKLDFKEKANRLQCKSIIIDNGYEYDPRYDKGGGMLDILDFAFRIVFWAIERPRRRNLIILDEPFTGLGVKAVEAAIMLKHLSKAVSEALKTEPLQIIILTHIIELMQVSDTCYNVTNDGTTSTIKRLK